MKNDSKKILIIDDEKKIVEVIQSYLEHNGFKTLAAYDSQTGLNIFKVSKPDLVILDLMLPGISGEEICKTIRKQSLVPIIMLTAKINEDDILFGLDIGADDYITKPFSPRQLLARVVALLRRSEGTSPIFNIVSFNDDDLVIDFSAHTVKKQGEVITLTPNEFKLLSGLIRHPNKAFTREELIEIAFGIEYDGFERTIDSHIKNLRSKIESDTKKPVYVLTVHGVGYKFDSAVLPTTRSDVFSRQGE